MIVATFCSCAANDGFEAVVICSEDTVAFVTFLSFHDAIRVPLFQKCITKIMKRVIYIKKVFSYMGIPVFSFSWHAYILLGVTMSVHLLVKVTPKP